MRLTQFLKFGIHLFHSHVLTRDMCITREIVM